MTHNDDTPRQVFQFGLIILYVDLTESITSTELSSDKPNSIIRGKTVSFVYYRCQNAI